MKIAMLGWELPPHNSGGLGIACYHMAKGLASKGVDIDFIIPYEAKHAEAEKHFKVHGATSLPPEVIKGNGAYDSHDYTLDDGLKFDGNLRNLQKHYARFVEKFVAQTKPDIIHAHEWLTFEAATRAKEMTNRPVIAHVHATEFDRSGEHHGNPVVHEIEYNGLMMADKIIAVSNITKDIIVREYSIPADKISVLHNGIDVENYVGDIFDTQTYVYLDAMKRRGYTVVVTVTRLTVQKGLRYLIEAAAKAIAINDKLLFLIAGDGEQRDELFELAADYGISRNIVFTGTFVRGLQWRDAYRVGDAFVMSSVSEPFGLTALEAVGYGNAVVLTKQSGVGEVLKSALKYDYWDTDRLADCFVNIAMHSTLRDELMKNGKEEFSRFSWQDVCDRCVTVYDDVHQGALV